VPSLCPQYDDICSYSLVINDFVRVGKKLAVVLGHLFRNVSGAIFHSSSARKEAPDQSLFYPPSGLIPPTLDRNSFFCDKFLFQFFALFPVSARYRLSWIVLSAFLRSPSMRTLIRDLRYDRKLGESVDGFRFLARFQCAHAPNLHKKLSYRRGTARRVVSIEILPVATQQCRNYLYDNSWPNRWYEVGDLVGDNA